MAYAFPVPVLPQGFTFIPSDEDVVVKYLRLRAANLPVPCPIIVDVEIMRHSPWDLIPEGSMEKYFFTQKELKYRVGTRRNRITGDGYWRATGTEVPVYTPNGADTAVVVGMKRSLVFYRGNAPNGEPTIWAMHEYRLTGAGLCPYRVMRPAAARANNQDSRFPCAATIDKNNPTLVPVPAALVPVMVYPDESWVVCRVYKKKPRAHRVIVHAANAWGHRAAYIDYMGEANRELSPAGSCTNIATLTSQENKNSNNEVMNLNDD